MHMKKTLQDEDHESTQMMNGQKTVLSQGRAHLPENFEDFRLFMSGRLFVSTDILYTGLATETTEQSFFKHKTSYFRVCN